MRRRLFGMATALAVGLGLAACGSSSHHSGSGSSGSSGSGGGGGSVTLKLVAADYGTGPSNTSSKYWGAIASAFHKANPTISVKVTVVPWTNFDSQIQTLVQNHNYPDITEGDYFSAYAQQGLLYPASQVLSNPASCCRCSRSRAPTTGPSTACRSRRAPARCSTTSRSSPRQGSTARRGPGPT